MDHRHAQFHTVKAEVEKLRKRMDWKEDQEGAITTGPELRDAVQQILGTYSDGGPGRALLLRAGALEHHLTFDVCASLGGALGGGFFDVDMKALTTSHGNEGLFNDRVISVWENKLEPGALRCVFRGCVACCTFHPLPFLPYVRPLMLATASILRCGNPPAGLPAVGVPWDEFGRVIPQSAARRPGIGGAEKLQHCAGAH